MTPVFGHGIGLSVPQIATLMSSGLIGGLLMQWPLGKNLRSFRPAHGFIVLTFLTAPVALAMVPLVKSGFSALIIGIILYGGINFALYPLALAHTNDYLSAEQVVPAAAGMILAIPWAPVWGPAGRSDDGGGGAGRALHLHRRGDADCSVPSPWRARRCGGRSQNHSKGGLSRCRA